MDKKTAQELFQQDYQLGLSKKKPQILQVGENKHGIVNKVIDLNTTGTQVSANLTFDSSGFTQSRTVTVQDTNGIMALISDLIDFVIGPSTNTDSYIPQWDGTDSKTLKDGLGVVTVVANPGDDTNVPTEKAVRDSLAGVMANPMTTTGDMIFQNDSGFPDRLGQPPNNQADFAPYVLNVYGNPSGGNVPFWYKIQYIFQYAICNKGEVVTHFDEIVYI